ncbi:hypothetical protein ACU686_19620 [Yinghuangia aomiensis]
MARAQPDAGPKNMAADHAAADRLRMPVDEYRGPRDDAAAELAGSCSLLGRSGRAASSRSAVRRSPVRRSPRPRSSRSPPTSASRSSAGVSGLTARPHARMRVWTRPCTRPIRSRIGGRMYTQKTYWGNGQTSEVGGELVDTGHKKMLGTVPPFRAVHHRLRRGRVRPARPKC